MLNYTKNLYGLQLAALDGSLGHVQDFYFDDWNWVIRYLVAEADAWRPVRLVLLSPHAFGRLNQFENTLHLKLPNQKLVESPALDPSRPFTRKDESAYFRHYGWPVYWEGPELWGLDARPLAVPPTQRGETSGRRKQHHHREEKHLQSARGVLNYHIQTTDGTVGHVTGFLVDDKSWAIHQLVVETGDWLSGREILIDPSTIERVSYQTFKIFVRLNKADMLQNEEPLLVHAGSGRPGTENPTAERSVEPFLRQSSSRQ